MIERASLIVRCSREDATRLRTGASSEHRSLSGYVIRILEHSIAIEDKFIPLSDQRFLEAQARSVLGTGHSQARTAVHLRCTADDAEKIRRCAARRRLSISDFVVFSVRRKWNALERLQKH